MSVVQFNGRLHPLHPTQAEHDLIELVRGNDASEFSLLIHCFNGRWQVTTIDHSLPPTDPPSNKSVGEGDTFADAWHAQQPTWATE